MPNNNVVKTAFIVAPDNRSGRHPTGKYAHYVGNGEVPIRVLMHHPDYMTKIGREEVLEKAQRNTLLDSSNSKMDLSKPWVWAFIDPTTGKLHKTERDHWTNINAKYINPEAPIPSRTKGFFPNLSANNPQIQVPKAITKLGIATTKPIMK